METRARGWTLGFLLLMTIGCLLLVCPQVARAVPAARIVEQVAQPDGQIIWVRQYGDERGNGLETTDGYTILRHPDTGYWVYAEEEPGKDLRHSGLVVGRDHPAAIRKGLRAALSSPLSSSPLAAPSSTEEFGLAAPTLGSQPVLVLFVDFSPSVRVGATASSWNSLLFGTTGRTAKKFYEEVSYGAFTLAPAAESNTDLGGSANDGIVSVTLPYAHPNTGGTIDNRNLLINCNNEVLDACEYGCGLFWFKKK